MLRQYLLATQMKFEEFGPRAVAEATHIVVTTWDIERANAELTWLHRRQTNTKETTFRSVTRIRSETGACGNEPSGAFVGWQKPPVVLTEPEPEPEPEAEAPTPDWLGRRLDQVQPRADGGGQDQSRLRHRDHRLLAEGQRRGGQASGGLAADAG